MKKFLFGVMLFVSSTIMAQTQLYCRQFTLTDHGSYVTFTEPVCYKSPVKIEVRSNQEFTITTDSLSLRFVIIYRSQHTSPESNQDLFFASIVGKPGQVYAINRRIGNTGNFFLSCVPIRLNEKFNKMDGTAIEISNVEICDK